MIEVELADSGIGEEELRRHSATLRDALESMEGSPGGAFLEVAERRDLLREMRGFAAAQPAWRDVVQLGIGGSSLGAQAVCQALLPPFHNETAGRSGPRVHFPDNVDPETFGPLLERLDPRRTLIHVVSKSGGTLETAAQLSAVLERFERAGVKRLARHLVFTTGATGALRDFAVDEGIPVLSFPEHVAGRFSVLTASGLLVPLICGLRVDRVLRGARRVLSDAREDALVGPAGRLAATHFIHDHKHGRAIHVEWIYADALQKVGEWFVQLFAESLGKRERGPTPFVARGTTDQHSQLQLHMQGPDDKLYSFLRVRRFRERVKLGRAIGSAPIARKDLGRVLQAEAEGTRRALVRRGRPVISLELPAITPEAVGELLMLKELMTALAGALYRVDPFIQPGVEAGKLAALELLSSGSRRG